MKRIWVNQSKCLGCKSCELACAVERDSLSRHLRAAISETPLPRARVRVIGDDTGALPLQCRHCEDAPCISACPAGALTRDEESGNVYVESDKCCGCYMCVMACPFGVIYPRRGAKSVMKCDGCFAMDRPACVEVCPTGALFYGDTDELDALQLQKQTVIFEEMHGVPAKDLHVHIEYNRGN